jgi:alkylated DNA repair protein (DNA oxidative demethylase)
MSSSYIKDLFADEEQFTAENRKQIIAADAIILRGFASEKSAQFIEVIKNIAEISPFRHMIAPNGFSMSAAMTNCGTMGWTADRRGYRYNSFDPQTGKPWPAMPEVLYRLAVEAAAEAGFENFSPDACLINRYVPGARMSLHRDDSERDFSAPIVSVSLGLPIRFLFGGATRADKTRKLLLSHGDVVVWGGVSRLFYHAVSPLKENEDAFFGKQDLDRQCLGNQRINLTFRKAL